MSEPSDDVELREADLDRFEIEFARAEETLRALADPDVDPATVVGWLDEGASQVPSAVRPDDDLGEQTLVQPSTEAPASPAEPDRLPSHSTPKS